MVKRFFISVIFFLITSVLIPSMMLLFMGVKKEEKKTNKNKTNEISVLFTSDGKVHSMDIEEYLYGVVAAEMPAEFEKEALKAQAVAARSYAIYRMANPTSEHPDAAVCTDFAHCKAYKTDEELEILWKNKNDEYSQKILDAVYSTAGEVITYNGEVAMAVFHSQTGSGRTENSKDVWGGEVPYLISVASHGEETAPNFYSTQTVTTSEFKEKLTLAKSGVNFSGGIEIGEPEYSEGGSIKSVKIGGVRFSGREIRSIFNLRSSCFKIKECDEVVTFEVTGYGHGVGMSQYGANTMAKEGRSYIEILTHYYSGTQIEGG